MRLTHGQVLATIASKLLFLDTVSDDPADRMGPQDTYLSFLPLAHIYDRLVWPARQR